MALKGTQPKLEIHEGRGGLVMVRNLTRFHVADATETLTLLGSAIDARTVWSLPRVLLRCIHDPCYVCGRGDPLPREY